jgi:FkbM family methyltransferase
LRLIARILLLLKFISTFGARGLPIAWKLYVGQPGKLVWVPLPGGHRVYVRKRTSDVAVFRQAFLERDADFKLYPQGAWVMKRYEEILNRGHKPLVIVCGANTGLSAIFFVLLFTQAQVVALEPSPDNFKLLQLNAGLYPSIIPINAGVWDKKTHLRIMNPTADPLEYQTVECGPAEPDALATLTIDEVLAKFPDSEPLVVKIDIEGSEQALFQSHTDWMARVPLMIVELHDWLLPQRMTSSTFFALLPRMQCDFVVHGENVLIFNWVELGKRPDADRSSLKLGELKGS